MLAVAVDIELLSRAYFWADEPVKHNLKNGNQILIHPFPLKDSELFLSSIDLFMIDKNSMPSVEIIQMSYLEFILNMVKDNPTVMDRFLFVMTKALNVDSFRVKLNGFKKPELFVPSLETTITANDFDDIKRIILYQNIVGYDDSYINPDIKKAMEETDYIKSKHVDAPSLERKIAIITAHCGISKKEQLEMTMRSHSMLFNEVVGEIEFTTTRPIALFGGQSNEIEHWIYPKKKNKFSKYFTDVDKYSNSMGGDKNAIKMSGNNIGNNYQQMFDNFNN